MPLLLLLPRQSVSRPSEVHNPTATRSSSGAPFYVWIIIAVAVVAILSGAIYFLYASLRARRLGLPQPSINPFAGNARTSGAGFSSSRRRGGGGGGGVMGWVKDKYASISSGGGKGYQGPPGGRTRGGFGALDPDEAWDAVGAEADYGYNGYDEQELGLRQPGAQEGPAGGHFGGGRGYAAPGGLGSIETGRDDKERARKGKQDLEDRYDEEMHGGNGTKGKVTNPFDDDEEESLRGVSPRPHEMAGHQRDGSGGGR